VADAHTDTSACADPFSDAAPDDDPHAAANPDTRSAGVSDLGRKRGCDGVDLSAHQDERLHAKPEP
jgi:hypothetical protein